MSDCDDNDLPLMANTSDIMVTHYMFNLSCDFNKKKFYGSSIMVLDALCDAHCLFQLSEKQQPSELLCIHSMDSHDNALKKKITAVDDIPSCDTVFQFILDCNDIVVKTVHELSIDDFEKHAFTNSDWKNVRKSALEFSVEKWCLKVWKPNIFCSCMFPRFVEIKYETKPCGQSLMWVPDQNGKPAVYTYGAWINNRSLFPCQEPPVAMATWEATISVPQNAVVVMSGDNSAVQSSSDGVWSYYYYTKMKLPLSTLALAIGYWDVKECFKEKQKDELHVYVRLLASPLLLSKAVNEFSKYVYSCVKVVESILGAYPFPRIDFLIVPRGFASLGMASPNVIFISQSLLAGDRSMCCRIAHEVAHAWFGLLIGASDWTEEWLSEGFATFMEDIIHTKAIAMTAEEATEYSDYKAFMRSKILYAEVKNTKEELHILRPNKGKVLTEEVDGIKAVILKNGKDPEKGFMQVHYIKGYFLLKYLSELVGMTKFLQFLSSYVCKFRGKLVDSLEMLQFYCESFSAECADVMTVERIASEWLHSAKIPKPFSCMKLTSSSNMSRMATQEAGKWSKVNRSYLSRRCKKRKKIDEDIFCEISSEILCLVLDVMLRKDAIAHSVLRLMEQVYDIKAKNAEIRHKWCELVVKHRYYSGYDSLKKFLENDLAMGIYLYGELILAGTDAQRSLAEGCFHKVCGEMEPNCVTTILQMLRKGTD